MCSSDLEVVTVLVQSASEFVTKDHLMERVWPGATVGEGTIHVHISAVRKALGQDRAIGSLRRFNTVFAEVYRRPPTQIRRARKPSAT